MAPLTRFCRKLPEATKPAPICPTDCPKINVDKSLIKIKTTQKDKRLLSTSTPLTVFLMVGIAEKKDVHLS